METVKQRIMFKKLVLVNILCLVCVANGARILGIVPSASYSHQVAFQPIWRELSLRGHQVTTLTTDPINDPQLVNLTEIDLSFSYDDMREYVLNLIHSKQLFKGLLDAMTGVVASLDKQLQYHQVQDLIKSEDVKFDLVMVEYLNPSMIAFAEKFQCPHIGILSVDAPNDIYTQFGNPAHPVLYPDNVLPRSSKSTVLNRLMSIFYAVAFSIFVTQPVLALEQNLVEKHFGPNYPTIETMMQSTSLLFVNSDPVCHSVRPLVPAVIQIGGGLHRTTPKPLPEVLKNILDNASSGFIYFSLGSNVKSSEVPLKIRNVMLAAFSELPYTILWKFESDELPNKPSNVFISKWLPQQDILKHANIKLFITQGGLQSMDEAIYDHVPMIGMPYFWDQPHNVKMMVKNGFGLSLDHNTLEKEHFKETILEVINNPKYKNKVKELAELSSDQPMTGLERAVWWTEYVLRHKGAKHLRSPALDIPWYQYFLLDVVAVFALTISILLLILYVLIKLIVKIICLCCSKLKMKVKTL